MARLLPSEEPVPGKNPATSKTVVLDLGLKYPHLATYRGLSGLDSALYVLAAGSILVEAWRPRRPWLLAAASLALALFAAKTLFELASGGAVFMRAEGLDVVVVPLAHLLGALFGAVGGCYIAARVETTTTHQARDPR